MRELLERWSYDCSLADDTLTAHVDVSQITPYDALRLNHRLKRREGGREGREREEREGEREERERERVRHRRTKTH